MKRELTRLTAFVGRHWLRIGLIVGALMLLSQKQVNFNVKLGHPDLNGTPATVPLQPTDPVAGEEPPLLLSEDGPSMVARAGGFFSRFNFFGAGGDAADRVDLLALQGDVRIRGFVERFGHVAQAEQDKFGIPASVILALGLLNSEAGQAPTSQQLNNYFALTCDRGWSGQTGQVAGSCQRQYESAWASFRDFSTYLTSGSYTRLQQFDARDYRRWALGLEELGYRGATAAEIVRVVEGYGLARFD
ncbi:hypothetical protein LEM8419_03353 [Neolewinella maritima]|uniref:Mannosyl-glycoprotein endo-beta-N-acetylglucosamidase-like domain-containing protein n=1 Tax=Neolewinella maritima TaxID=1383882 RepID=A0ABN8F692_9BACT|nr:glucosaminidase domain-containing protein [Neolewinella maritima]CAH1002474.1 hypothetical protein LEM8419_03353 [Neolewinella maritima]